MNVNKRVVKLGKLVLDFGLELGHFVALLSKSSSRLGLKLRVRACDAMREEANVISSYDAQGEGDGTLDV
jgi:hypothetical protein